MLSLRGSVVLVDDQCDDLFWVIVEMKTLKDAVRIFLKMSTGLSLNSCVDCKNKYLRDVNKSARTRNF